MNKEEARQIIIQCARAYKQNLCNKNVLFVYSKNDSYEIVETVYRSSNYLHLTGVKTSLSANRFYDACIANKLSINDFNFDNTGWAIMKLNVLWNLVNIHKTVKMIGDYDNSRPKLYTEKLAGNVSGVIGYTKHNNFFSPNTVLKENIKNITTACYPVIAVYRKNNRDTKYVERFYFSDNALCSEIENSLLNNYNIEF